ncbi:hypothetical protein PMKS-000738 [Pichia membranifaciens]|uniref:FAD/NAD(P)-binding domain-containing protein n=1 Tax=Pichia membranifaciens TaxID=4926 RepID=A0A1Q2YCK8_9ASCO|nr:hypothetical protein PMKS-000738 [Pichia membranifaciens]
MKVKKIGIIGAGPGGLVALNEFIHTGVDGRSTITSLRSKENKLPEKGAFDEIVIFEQGANVGGVWNYTSETDPDFPTGKDYSDPNSVRPSLEAPTEEELKNSSKEKPFCRKIHSIEVKEDRLWNKSAVYDELFTNIPNRLMKFSSGFDIDYVGTEKEFNRYHPFATHQQVLKYIQDFTSQNHLKKYIRFNSTVEKVYKKEGKWVVVVAQIDRENGVEEWYSETFDAVLLAVGRFNIPFVPEVENLEEFEKKHPGVVSHTKSFRSTDEYAAKKVLLVGSSISATDLLQYLLPKSKEIWLSSNSTDLKKNLTNNEHFDWMDDILADESIAIHRCSRIKRFTENGVEFTDGQKVENFDKILFATGYHMSYPFLNIPENKGKSYIKVSSGRDDQPNYAHTKIDDVYLYTFSVDDPTLGHIGIPQNPLFFLTAEVNAIALAGVWSGYKHLPPTAEQIEWCSERLRGKNRSFQLFNENSIRPYYSKLYELAPANRVDLQQILRSGEIAEAKKVLKKLFYAFASGELQ